MTPVRRRELACRERRTLRSHSRSSGCAPPRREAACANPRPRTRPRGVPRCSSSAAWRGRKPSTLAAGGNARMLSVARSSSSSSGISAAAAASALNVPPPSAPRATRQRVHRWRTACSGPARPTAVRTPQRDARDAAGADLQVHLEATDEHPPRHVLLGAPPRGASVEHAVERLADFLHVAPRVLRSAAAAGRACHSAGRRIGAMAARGSERLLLRERSERRSAHVRHDGCGARADRTRISDSRADTRVRVTLSWKPYPGNGSTAGGAAPFQLCRPSCGAI